MVIVKPWPDCRCPLGINYKPVPFDRVPYPHACGISKDEGKRYYICDHDVYLRLSEVKQSTMIGKWVAKRLKEGRLFVIRGPMRPKRKKVPAWMVEEVDMNAIKLAPGWKGWMPDLAEYIIHRRNVDDFFRWLGVVERWRIQEMTTSGIGFLLACGFMPGKLNGCGLFKYDRVYVTGSHDFYQCVMKVWSRINHFLYDVELGPGHIGPKMGYLQRLSDIESDARVAIGGCGHL